MDVRHWTAIAPGCYYGKLCAPKHRVIHNQGVPPVLAMYVIVLANKGLDISTLGAYMLYMFTFVELHPFAAVRDKYLTVTNSRHSSSISPPTPPRVTSSPGRAVAGRCGGRPRAGESEEG